MKYFTIVFAMITIVLSSCNSTSKNEQSNTETTQTFNLDTTGLKSGEKFYQCEMDPEVLSDKPGNCPKCGMALTERIKQ